MIIHKLYYGDFEGEGLTVKTSEGIRSLVTDDIIIECYSLEAATKPLFDSRIHQTLNGPVISLTKVEPDTSTDNRKTMKSRTIFVALSDVIKFLSPLLEFRLALPLKPTITKELITDGKEAES